MSLLRGVSFAHLKKKTREVTLSGVYVRSDKEVVLELQYANDVPGWKNAYRTEDAKQTLATRPLSEWFQALLPAFAEYVVVGWRNVNGEDGAAVAVYAEGVVEIMKAYAEQAFDLAVEHLIYAIDPNNFRDFKPPPDAEALGKR